MTEFCPTTHKSEPNDQNFSFKGTHITKERRSSVFDRKKTVTDFRKKQVPEDSNTQNDNKPSQLDPLER